MTPSEKLIVRTLRSYPRELDTLRTGFVADRLGISTARVREVLRSQPDLLHPPSDKLYAGSE